MAQATHQGECQICGRIQKLPSGDLSKHGYTVDWGFFNGTCRGSGYLPFEQDKSLIDQAIIDATAHQTWLVFRISELREDTNPAKAYVSYFKRGTGSTRWRSSYEHAWVETSTIVVAAKGGHLGQWVATVTERDGTEHEACLGYTYNTTAVQAAYKCNEYLAKNLERDNLAGITQYIDWQTERIKNWTVKPLKKI